MTVRLSVVKRTQSWFNVTLTPKYYIEFLSVKNIQNFKVFVLNSSPPIP